MVVCQTFTYANKIERQRKKQKSDYGSKTLKIGDGLAVTKEIDGGISLSNRSEGLEDVLKATNTEKGELSTSIPKPGAES